MHSPDQAQSVISTSREDRDRFCSDLADGLHAMAQPLTILRSSTEALKLGPAIDQQRYLEISARQVERTCWLFSCLQDLVSAQRSEPACKVFDLWELVGASVEGHRKRLAAIGIGLALTETDFATRIRGDAERTGQAVDAVFRSAGAVSSRGDVLEMGVHHRNGFVEVRLENNRSHGKCSNATDRFGLAVAEANILSQQGRYSFVADPFSVSLMLPSEAECEICEQALLCVH